MDNRQYRKFIHLVQCHQHDKHTDDLQAHHGRNKEKYRKRARYVIDEVNYNPICMTCFETVTWESVHGESFSATVQRNKSFGISVFEGRHRKFSTINFSAAFQEAISYEKDNYTDAFERIWREVHHGTRKLPGPNHDTYAKWLDSVTPTAEECFGIEWEEQEEEELAVRKVDPTQYLPDISECPIFVRRGQEEQGRNIVDEDGNINMAIAFHRLHDPSFAWGRPITEVALGRQIHQRIYQIDTEVSGLRGRLGGTAEEIIETAEHVANLYAERGRLIQRLAQILRI